MAKAAPTKLIKLLMNRVHNNARLDWNFNEKWGMKEQQGEISVTGEGASKYRYRLRVLLPEPRPAASSQIFTFEPREGVNS